MERSESSFEAAALPECLHLFLTHALATVQLLQRGADGCFFFLVQHIQTAAPRLDFAGRFGSLHPILLGPGLDAAENLFNVMIHRPKIASFRLADHRQQGLHDVRLAAPAAKTCRGGWRLSVRVALERRRGSR